MEQCEIYCFTLQNAVDDDLLWFARTYIKENLHRFESNRAGEGRRFLIFDASTQGLERFGDLKMELADRFDLGAFTVPPILKDFIGYVTEGGLVHEHTDQDLPGKQHVRINVLINQSEGCIPIMEGVPISVAPRDAWLNLASKCRHGTTMVKGSKSRSVISFGYQIDPRRGSELHRLHLSWRSHIVYPRVRSESCA